MAEPVKVAADGGQQRPAFDDPRIPWSGKPGRADILCWAGIMLSGIFYWATLPFRASLVGTHPVFLVLLNGSTEGIVAAAAFARIGHGTLIVVLLAALVGMMKFDPLYWWAGRLWGERVIALLGGRRNRGAKYMGRVQRWGRKFTWPAVIVSPFLPIPSAIIYVIAGWAGMRLVTFIILDAIGTLLWAGTLAGLGYALGHHAVVVAQTISHYGLWISIGLIVVIVFFQVRSQRHMMRTASEARAAARPTPPPAAPIAPQMTRPPPRGQRLDWRTTRRQGTVRVPRAGSPAIAASSRPAATRPTSSRRMSMLVSGGWARAPSAPSCRSRPGRRRPDGPAGRAERVGHATGDLVAAAEDRVGVRLVGQQLARGFPAPPLAPLAEPRAATRSQASRCQRGAEPCRPLACRQEPLGPGDVPDPLPARAEQVPGGGPPATLVIRQHRGPVLAQRLGHRVHHRDAGPAVTGRLGSIRRPVTIRPSTRRAASIST